MLCTCFSRPSYHHHQVNTLGNKVYSTHTVDLSYTLHYHAFLQMSNFNAMTKCAVGLIQLAGNPCALLSLSNQLSQPILLVCEQGSHSQATQVWHFYSSMLVHMLDMLLQGT